MLKLYEDYSFSQKKSSSTSRLYKSILTGEQKDSLIKKLRAKGFVINTVDDPLNSSPVSLEFDIYPQADDIVAWASLADERMTVTVLVVSNSSQVYIVEFYP